VSALLGGWLRGRSGDLERGLKRVHESLDAYMASGSKLGLPHFHILIADLHRVAGDRDGAFDLIRRGEEYIEETGERLSESELYRFKGRLLMSREAPDPPAATAAFERAIAAAREQNAKLLELQGTVRLAEHQLKLGAQASALGRASELCDWFGDSPLPDVARARALLQSESMAR
jgi:predicted ATPase